MSGGGAGGSFNPSLEYAGDDATSAANGGSGRVLKLEDELVLTELSKVLAHCGLPVPEQVQTNFFRLNTV